VAPLHGSSISVRAWDTSPTAIAFTEAQIAALMEIAARWPSTSYELKSIQGGAGGNDIRSYVNSSMALSLEEV
jgi:hypothetical protein